MHRLSPRLIVLALLPLTGCGNITITIQDIAPGVSTAVRGGRPVFQSTISIRSPRR